jgi:hypothetical protein
LNLSIEKTSRFIKRKENNIEYSKKNDDFINCFHKAKKLLEISEDYSSLVKYFELCLNLFTLISSPQGASLKNLNPMSIDDNFESFFNYSFKSQITKLFKSEMAKVASGQCKCSRNSCICCETQAFREELKFFAKLMTIDFKIDLTNIDTHFGFNTGFSKNYNKSTIATELLFLFSKRLSELKFDSVLELRVNFDFSQLGASQEKILNQFDIYFHEKLVNDSIRSFRHVYELLKDTNCIFYISRLSENYLNTVLKNTSDFSYLLRNDLILLMFELNSTDQSNKVLTKKYEDILNKQAYSFIECIRLLISGEVRIDQIKLLKQFKENACKLISILSKFNIKDSPFNQTELVHFKNLIEFRHNELTEFVMFRSKLTNFVQFCSNFKDIDLELLKRDQKNLSNIKIEEKSLSQFCRPVTFVQIQKNFTRESPLVIYFKSITKRKIEQIEKFIQLDRLKCVLFDHLMNESLDNYKNEMGVELLSVDTILNEVEDEVFEKWRSIANKIDSGRIKLAEIDDYLKKFFSNNEKKLINEFVYIIEKCQIPKLAQRRNEISLYFRFKSSVEIAKIIEAIRINFKMTNTFPELNELLSISSTESKDWTIEKMDSKVEKVIGILNRMNEGTKMNCLRAFNASIELVEWLRTSLKDIKELKFLIDLASIAKNADSSQAYKKDLLAKILKESCIAYSPLIFDLKLNDNFTRFVELCDTVWSNLESDKSIADKLIEAKKELSVLKELKEKKGKSFNQILSFNLKI